MLTGTVENPSKKKKKRLNGVVIFFVVVPAQPSVAGRCWAAARPELCGPRRRNEHREGRACTREGQDGRAPRTGTDRPAPTLTPEHARGPGATCRLRPGRRSPSPGASPERPRSGRELRLVQLKSP